MFELCNLSVPYVQGLGGLHKCDYPATHDSEYNKILMIHTHICRCCHHPSFHYCTSFVCFQACDSELASSDRINCFDTGWL